MKVQTEGLNSQEREAFFSNRWSGLVLAIIMGLIGFILIILSQLLESKFEQLPDWLVRLLLDSGLAFVIAGTASFLIEQLIRKRTEAEFRRQLNDLLGASANGLSAEMKMLLDNYIKDIESRVESVKAAIRNSNIEMIFAKRQDGFEDMARAILEAKEIIYIMGVSLREFSKMPTPVCRALKEVHSRRLAKGFSRAVDPDHPDIKMLVLNNQSVEALNRSSIEARKEFKGFADPEYKVSHLFLDTRDTILDIDEACPEIQLRVYDNLSLFLLVTDHDVFMEPYHSGVKSVGIRPLKDKIFERVAELVPMIQFRKEAEPGPYEQFRNHFVHVYDQAHEPTPANTDIGDSQKLDKTG